MLNYSLVVVDSLNVESDFNWSTVNYDKLMGLENSAIVDELYVESNDLNKLLREVISGLNEGNFSDQNWYFITDNKKKEILYL